MSPSRPDPNTPRGWIVPIGGRIADPDLLRRFVELAGGSDARIAIIPTASSDADTGEATVRTFRDLGADTIDVVAIDSRADCSRDDILEIIGEADGIFLTGGNQLRLSTTLGGTPVAKLLRVRNAAGVHVAGTSAGAAFLSEHMIAFGDEGASPRSGMVTLAAGLGLTNRVIIDQHFRERDRLGRLLTALAYNPFAVGLGLDEDTAAYIAPDELMHVEGTGGVTVVDPSQIEYSSMDAIQRGDPVSITGVRLHVLVKGAAFNLSTREVHAAGAVAGRT
ncbi:MAG TPA: cyanophycinase [Gemmatimonadaceae bacterium]|nr:cyanophycinase [Gemmatimonadaceae bacterium]